MGTRTLLVALACALTLAGCSDKLVGFEARIASNVVAAKTEPPSGDQLRFRLPKTIRDAQRRTVHLAAYKAELRIAGYAAITPEAADDAGDGWNVRMRLPGELMKKAAGASPNSFRLQGELRVPTETSVRSRTGVELREPSPPQVVPVLLAAVHEGPQTRMAEGVGGFFRGLYSAR